MDRKQKKRKAPIIEALEPRILFSADLFGGATDNPGADDSLATLLDDTATVLEKQTDQLLKDQTDTALYELPAEDDDVSLAPAKDAIRTELVFVDTDTPDYQQLVDDMLSGSDENRRLEVILLDNNSDGIEQITSALQDYQGIDAVHLISHGEDGVVDLGNTQLNNQTLATYQAQLQSWAAHLNADADILFYGCDLAASEDGQILINRIASFTGADIAASEDLTGNAELGGDWELEYNAGQIEAQIALSEQVQVTWQGSLSQSLWLSTDSNVTSSGANGLDSWTEGQVLEFSGASLAHGDTTAGDLSMVIDFDNFTSNSVDAGGLHFVSHDMTVGGANGTFDLKAGDVLVSFLQDETILAAHSSTNADMPVQDQDLLVFRPDAFNDYSAGTFTVLLDDVVADDLKGFTLIEQDTTIGGTDVAAGSFLLIAETSGTTSIDLFVPTGVGEATTTGTTTPLIDISDLGIDPDRLRGIEVVEAATTIGGQSLAKGDILATLNVDDSVSGVGSNNLPVDKNDVFVLSLTATGMGTTAGSATMFLDGSDVGLDDNPSAESPYALALHNYSQLTVDTTSDVADGDTSSIEALLLDKGADGKISLREAIEAANATPNGDIADTIRFNITDALVGGAHTISVGSALPSITDTLVMDGTSEPDFSGTPVIRLDGSGAGSNADGLFFASTSDNSTVRGFMITGFDRDGIYGDSGADYLTFTGNWIGTTGAGSTGVGNGDDGMDLRGSNATIGGTGANEGNVITNSGDEGLQIFGTGVTAHLVQGNFIGLDPDGESGSGNNDVGLAILSGSGNIFGGTTASARNVISNNFEGIEVNSSNNVFQGNYIGTDASGTLDRGNRSDDGIEIKSGATGNLIGGTETGAGNLIAFNARDGVNIVDGSGNTVLGNQIHSNSDLGIDLDTGGVTSNDSNDGDTGANNLQNYPTITTADLNGSNLTLSGTLDTDGVSTSYRIEFFGNAAGTQDATNGEGRFFLGSTTVTTDVNGDASFNDVLLSGITLSDGDYVSATATRIDDAGQVGIDDQLAYGDTSEFAVNIAITAVNDAPELSGANDLNPINEDEVGNAGTLVSDIIAGQISDADSNSVEGIAVTAVDDTNGTWQYTIDGGTNWVAFGAVDSSNARLLAADTNTSVRFVPDANWNGTVTNGITLHAWDQTSGTAGGTADLTSSETVRDNFDAASYSNNDGTTAWTGSWQEIGESDGPGNGDVYVGTYLSGEQGLHFADADRGAWREADLSGATSATLSLNYTRISMDDIDEYVALEISDDGGATWVELDRFGGPADDTAKQFASYDITSYISSNTRIQFISSSANGSTDDLYIDDVQISQTTLGGGSSAFSTVSDTASLLVNPVADTPSVTGATTNEDTQSTSGLVVTRNAADGAEVTHYKITGIADGTLYQNDGVTQITNGSFITVAEGSAGLKFTPDADFNGTGNFTLQASTANSDAGLGGSTVDATININQINDTAVFSGDTTGSGDEDTVISGTLTASDSADGMTSPNYTVTTDGANGTASIDAAGNWSYTPAANYSGSDSFTVSVTDDDGNVETQVISITVNAVADLSATDDSFSVDEDTTLNDTVASNDSTTSGGALSYAVNTDVSNGGLTLNNDGSFSYTPTANYHGSDSFTYTVTDADSGESSTQTVSLIVNQINDTAVFSGDTTGSGDEDTVISGTLTASDSADGLTSPNYTVSTDGANGTASIDAAGNWSYTPAANYSGSDSFTVSVTDDDGNVENQVINLTVNAVADLTTQDDSFSLNEDTTLNDTVASNDSTTSGGALSYAVNTDVSNGSLTLNNDGSFSYTPSSNYHGSDSFTYTVTDADSGESSTQTVSLTVNQVDDAGTFGGDVSATTNEDTATSGTVTFADATDGYTANTFALTSGAANGTAAVDSTGNWSYTPSANYSGADSFVVQATDDVGNVENQVISITVNAVTDLTATDDSFTLNEDTTLNDTVASNDSTTSGGALSYAVNTDVSNGGLTLNNDGSFSYTPTANYHGSDSFTYTVTDADSGESSTQTVSLIVNQINDTAVFSGDTTGSGDEDTVISGTLTASDSADGLTSPNYTVSTDGANGTASIDAAGNWSYTPAANYSGSDSFTVSVTDDDGNVENQVINLTVNAVADLTTQDDSFSLNEDTTLNDTVASNDSTTSGGALSYAVNTDVSNGSLTLNNDGSFSYTPSSNYHGSDSFTYTVTDADSGESSTQTVSLTVNQVDDAGTFGGDTTGSGDEDTVISGTLTASDSADGLTSPNYTVSTDGANGTASIDAAGNWSYTPAANYSGSDSFTVSVTDDDGNVENQVINLTVNAVADLTTQDDSFSLNEDTTLNDTVATNDSTTSGGALSYALASDVSNGSLTLNNDGSFSYTPTANYHGSDSFTYTVIDADSGESATQTVSLTVNQVDDAGTFGGDVSATTNEDTATSGTVTFADATDGYTANNFALTSGAGNGTAAVDSNGNWSYTPSANYSGADSFVVQATDDDGNVETQVISITVNAVTDLTAQDDSFSLNEDTTLSDTVASNDSTTSGGALSYALASDVSNGSLTLNNDGSFSYTPTANYHGSDSFTYTVTDADSGESATQTVAITVNPVDDAVTIGGDTSGSGAEDTVISGTLTASDSADGLTDGSYFTVSTDASNGAASIDAATGLWSYTANADFNGSDSFTVTVTDDDGYTDTQVVSVTVTPVADIVDDSLTTNEETAITANVLTGTNGASADNFEGTPTLTAVTNGSNGSVSFLGDGTVTYTPDANFNGSDSFTYTITSGGVTETGTVNVTVNAVADLTAQDDSFTLNEDTTLNDTVATNDSTTSGGALSYALASDVSNGSLTLNNDGSFSYTPSANYHGSDGFTYTVTDADSGESSTQTVSLTVNQINDTAVFSGDTTGSGDEDTVISGTLTASDSADGLTSPNYTVSTDGANGTASIDAAGNWSYTPAANYSGSDSFTVSVTDDDGNVENQVINLTVNAVADLTAQDDSFSLNEDTTLNDTVASNDSTTSGGALSYALASDVSNGSLTLNNDGSFSYTPASNYHGSDSFTYTVTDADSGESATQTVAITVTPVDDAVTIGGDTSGSGAEDTVISGTLTASDSADGLTDGSYFTVSTDASNGAASIDAATGLWSYTANADFNGSDSFTVTVTDDDGYTDTQVVSVTVTPVADIVDDSLTTNEETAITANVLTGTNGASADNFEGTPTLTAVTNGSNGSVSFLGDGTVTYTPDANFNGSDSFTYTITSGGVTETGTVTVTVNAVTDLTATDDSFSVDEDTTLNDTVATNDSTTSGGALSYALASDVSNGSLTLNNDGSFSYTPSANYHGSDSFTYMVTDADSGESATETVSLTVNQINDTAVFSGDTTGSGDEDTVISGTLTASDSADGMTSPNYTVTTDGANGTASIDAAGNWSYTPTANWSGTDQFTVTVVDDEGGTHEQVVSITLVNKNDLPTGSVTISTTTGLVADGPLTSPSPQPEFEPALKPAPAPEAGPESEPESESESDLEPETEPAVAAVTVGDERLAPIDDELLVQALATEPAVPERYQYENDSPNAIPPKSIDLLSLGLAPFEPEKNEVGDLAWLMDNPAFVEGIGDMKRDLDDSVTATANQEKFKTEVLLGATAGLSVGVISWVLRTGSLIAGFMSIAPLWRQVDPIPILGEDAQEHQEKDALDEQEGAGSEVEQIFDEDSSR